MGVLRLAGIALAGVAACLFLSLRPAPPPPAVWDGAVVPGAVVSQGFGCTSLELEPVDESCPEGHFHSGLDLAAPQGTAVRTPQAGTARTGQGGSCGVHLLVFHAAATTTLYCHLAAALVQDGTTVTAGQQIGRVGMSGLATGPHLHFEVHRHGLPVDPQPWLKQLQANPQKTGGNQPWSIESR